MDEILEHLKDGIRRFQREIYPEQAAHYQRVMSEPQSPHALIITCADSRIHPEVLTQASPGDVFVTRNIGNIVPGYGEMLGGVSAVLEFAVRAMRVEHIVVCGHSECGAMKALLEPDSLEPMPTVRAWLRNAQLALTDARAMLAARNEGLTHDSPEQQRELLRLVTEQNVLLQMRHVRSHPSVAEALAHHELTISGWVYDIAEGQVRISTGTEGNFQPV